jgi:hypothetical protein
LGRNEVLGGSVPYQHRVIVIGAAAVLVFDLVASLASRSLGFDYARASVGSYILYFGIGFFAARGATSAPITNAAVAAAIVGLVDASLGWAISRRIGPGRPAGSPQLTVRLWVTTAIIVIGLAAAVGAAGGFVGRRPPPAGAAAA